MKRIINEYFNLNVTFKIEQLRFTPTEIVKIIALNNNEEKCRTALYIECKKRKEEIKKVFYNLIKDAQLYLIDKFATIFEDDIKNGLITILKLK